MKMYLMVFAAFTLGLAHPNVSLANDEEQEICSEKGYEAQTACVNKRCGKFARGSTAQLKCEEDVADLCETTGQDVEKRCLGIR